MSIASLLYIFGASFVVALSGAMMPGPLLTVTIAESSRRGALAGPLLILGHGILELLLLTALLLGLGPLLNRDSVFAVIALAGTAILLWMGVGILRALPRLSLSLKAEAPPRGRLVLSGATMSLANPFWPIWWATIGLACLAKWDAGPDTPGRFAGIAAFFTGHILGDLAWYTAVSVGVARGRRFLSDRVYRGILGGCAGFLLLFAVYFGYAGLTRWLFGGKA